LNFSEPKPKQFEEDNFMR
jgi:SHAQKYF class myb-like DNA-binding protein